MSWLDRGRITVYPRMFAALYVLIGGWWLLTGQGLLDRAGKPIGADFVTFYAASRLAGEGRAVEVWDVAALHAVERATIGADIPAFAWHYPPTFLAAVRPLASLPFLAAFALWVGLGVGAHVLVARRIAPDAATAGLALAFPGCFQNVLQGQNGLYTAAAMGGGLWLLDRRPFSAGLLLGLLTVKPQLAPLVALALLAGRCWRALGGFVVSAVLLAALATALFGVDAWRAFLDNAAFAVRVLELPGELPWVRMPTVQVAAMLLGAPLPVARGLQAVVGAIAAGVLCAIWARRSPIAARATALVAASLLATPFAFDYDLALYAIPVAFIGWEIRSGRGGGRALITAAWLAPLALPVIALATSVQLGPVLSIALLGAAWRGRNPGVSG